MPASPPGVGYASSNARNRAMFNWLGLPVTPEEKGVPCDIGVLVHVAPPNHPPPALLALLVLQLSRPAHRVVPGGSLQTGGPANDRRAGDTMEGTTD